MNFRRSTVSPRRPSVRTLVAIAVAAGVGAGIVACGSSAVSGVATPATPSAVGPATSATAEAAEAAEAAVGTDASPGVAAGGGAVDTINICQLLPVSTVASVTGEQLTQAAEDDTPQNRLYQCSYTNATGTDSVTVDALADGAGPGYDATLDAEGGGAKPITGLGDKAFSGITGVHALFGDVLIDVANLDSETAAVSLIKALQPKL